jgi:glutathione S-transferase
VRLGVADIDDQQHSCRIIYAAAPMRLKLYIVHGSHPCAAVEKALQLKGLDYSVREYPPPMHAPIQRVMFGARTVPALRIDGNEKVSGSRAIMHRLDELAPAPPLYPADPDKRAEVEDAERWGDETFQPLGRTLVWGGFQHSPAAMVSYSEGSRLPLPPAAIKASGPVVVRLASRLNRVDDDAVRRDLAAMPGYLDTIDGYIAAGTIGEPGRPNAADLQILSTLRLLMTLADLRPMIDQRPSADLALALFPTASGSMPVGSLPAA